MMTLAPVGVLRSLASASMWFGLVGSTATLVSLCAPDFFVTFTFFDAADRTREWLAAAFDRAGTVVKRPCVPRAPAPAGAAESTSATVATARPLTASMRAAG